MRSLLTRLAGLGPYVKGLLGGITGILLVLLTIHLVSLYLSLLQIIQFVNTYGPKIQKLP
jgi:hypothetical protein